MKTRRQKQQEALIRREADLLHYNKELNAAQADHAAGGTTTEWMIKNWEEKAARALYDVDRLRLSLGSATYKREDTP